MKVRYEGPADALFRELQKCAMRGWTLYKDADKIQAALDRAMVQHKVKKTLTRGGIA